MTQSNLEYHEIANMFPMMSTEDLKAQAHDIKKNGLIHPILLFEGKILDGRNRYVACGMANVEPRYEVFNGTFTDALERVWGENIHRRNLDTAQRVSITLSIEGLVERIKTEAKVRQGERTDIKSNPRTDANIPAIVPECKRDGSRASFYYIDYRDIPPEFILYSYNIH